MRGGGPDGAVLLGVLCGIAVFFVILLMIISVIMRFAVSLANKCLGSSSRSRSYDDDWDDDWDAPRYRRGRPGGAIPEPTFGKGMLIAFVAYLINAVVSFAIGIVFGVGIQGMGAGGMRGGAAPAMMLLAQFISAVVGFLIWSGILTAMLPTSFGRGALVTLFMLIIGTVIAIIIVVPLVFIIFATRGGP